MWEMYSFDEKKTVKFDKYNIQIIYKVSNYL